jgi:hypothetical protein
LGWFNSKESVGPSDTDWYSRSAVASGAAGWFWTDNLKTEVEAGATSRATLYGYWTEQLGPQTVAHSARFRHSTRRVAASQHYQFFRNAWFHPFVGAGVDLTWDTRERDHITSYPFVPPTGPSRHQDEQFADPATTEFDARPFVLVGYKAYLSPRVFFRNDLRFTIGHVLEEVMVRFGFGFDVTPRRRP